MNFNIKEAFELFIKGLAMGAANIIPGVSGGTVAFVTGIYERLFNAVKSFNLTNAKLLLKGGVKEFVVRTDLVFLVSVFTGALIGILSLARLFEFLLCNHEMLTMAFFFGLIIASVYLVAKQIKDWNVLAFILLLVGTGIAVGIGLMKPASSNDGFIYLVICGVIAMASMVLPGLSGSYVLLIMGNYLLIVSSIGDRDLGIIIPVAIGSVIGLVGFSHILSYIFNKFHDATTALLTGFVLGSLFIIWPWKRTIFRLNANGEYIDKYDAVIVETCKEGVVLGYERFFPSIDTHFFLMIGLILLGIILVVVMEKLGSKKPTN